MAIHSKFAREQYEALLAQEDSSRYRLSDFKSHFKKTVQNLRSTFTPKADGKSGMTGLSSLEELSPGFQGGHKLATMLSSSSTLPSKMASGSKSGSSSASGWVSTCTPNLSGSTLLSQYGDPEDAPTPWDSGLDLITPASTPELATPLDVEGTCKRLLSRTVRRVSHGSIHFDDGDYIRFGSINTGKVTLHRAPSVQSHPAISISSSELDDVETLAGCFPEIGELVA
ncbi:hypothetical protein M409DRAFT_22501 [Zasmidium cellare ATCC 36951]|uniref:Uncharacterized protein n=1 Tax=Zasmidium cellare ATCC 36951 TaxID=1080233 RepID=A0A6A6CNM5_ZASCE|nr:uncharacterized protein M409DRAFT_22501 [Zasmidium cellare ATCC 36951]KAF2167066.1 hypothetical protein M409DRAFT_22501 [Zasmidium cellare ATCC 36951]